jgi:CDP-glycerol glycerophosphotransferase (TagB/SpsB family)
MLTDLSGTGFTYAFTFDRPALFFAPDERAEAGMTGIQFERRENIGLVLRHRSEVVPAIQAALKHQRFLAGLIAEFRQWLLFNLGESEAFFAHHASSITDDTGPARQWPAAGA